MPDDMPKRVWVWPPDAIHVQHPYDETITAGTWSGRPTRDATPYHRDDVVQGLVGVLREAEEVLSLMERPKQPDPIYHGRVATLGHEIGFGALMATAEAGWREALQAHGFSGGERVSGPTRNTIERSLAMARAALAALDAEDEA